MDWTERLPHLAGALPAALLDRFLELNWLARRHGDRGLTITDVGQHHLTDLCHHPARLPERRDTPVATT